MPAIPPVDQRHQRAWYHALNQEFLASAAVEVLGRLSRNSRFPITLEQRNAWLQQIPILAAALKGVPGEILLEFSIPRMGRRIDAVVLLPHTVVVIEFKVGGDKFDRDAQEQVWDYALDLKNFHQDSHSATIIPVLVATAAKAAHPQYTSAPDGVFRPALAHPDGLRHVIQWALRKTTGSRIDSASWVEAPYRPTPTIVEAARALYAQHTVTSIARSDAGAKNLATTSRRIEEIVDQAQRNREKVICFVTGVPGAGKTLVGLNVATRRSNPDQPTHAVFLSGNAPLVAVLREALARDEEDRERENGNAIRRGVARRRVKAFIQNVHHFRDEALLHPGPPDDHVVIFDEAQRAWNLQETQAFMKRKKGRPDFTQSEPEFLLSYMDRHTDWAVVVCLVGGGQEINRGEAGIEAWLEAVQGQFPDWHMYISPRLTDSEYAAGSATNLVADRRRTSFDKDLHLGVSMRAFRAENVSAFVKAVLDCDERAARRFLDAFREKYPLFVTRDLVAAKRWLRKQARGTERYGLVASSKAMRLKPHAIDVRVKTDPVKWFLNPKDDTRSSFYLEDPATEFQIQGLELDWICVTWDGDLRSNDGCWSYHGFRGAKWVNVKNEANRRYLLNAYRVLLTRARQGMVIFVPPGDEGDPTRMPEFYNQSYAYLIGIGLPVLDATA